MSVPLCIWAGLVMFSMSTTLERTLLSSSCSQPVLLKQHLLGEGNSSSCQIAVVHSFGGRFFILNAINKPKLNYTVFPKWSSVMRPLATSPITLQLLAVLTSARYKDLHAQEGTAMLQCWYMTNQWCHSESSSQCGSTRCHNCSHCLSTGGWPVKLKECCECWGAMSQLSHLTQSYLPHHLCMHAAAKRQLCPSTTCPQRWLTCF